MRRAEAGSAYMIAISALAVLTTIGLALIAVTQTELQIGASERVANRVFYAADSGIAVATARALVVGNYQSVTYSVPDSPTASAISSTNQVAVSPFYPINDQPCNLCSINDYGEYSSQAFRNITHAVTVTANRQAVPAGFPSAVSISTAQKQISAMIAVQPKQSSTESYQATIDPAQLALIKF
jgi:hypothetical protein